jgi:hypothetical protein
MCHISSLLLAALYCAPDGTSAAAETFVRCESTVADASATTPPGTKWGYYYFLLLLDPNVQKEVGLAKPQLDRIETLKADFLDRVKDQAKGSAAGEGATPRAKNNARAAVPEKAGPTVDLFGPLSNKAINLLSDRQKVRLGQVIFQLRTIEIFFYPEVAKYLEFTGNQNKEVAAIRLALIDELRAMHARYVVKEKNSLEFQRQSFRLMQDGRARLLKTFNAEQIHELKGLEGKKIPFDQTNLKFEMHRKSQRRPTPIAEPKGRQSSRRATFNSMTRYAIFGNS